MCNLQLIKLDIGFNSFEDFPLCILNYKDLEELYINNNRIKSIPDELLAMRNLRVFYLDGNAVANDRESVRAIVDALRARGVEVKY